MGCCQYVSKILLFYLMRKYFYRMDINSYYGGLNFDQIQQNSIQIANFINTIEDFKQKVDMDEFMLSACIQKNGQLHYGVRILGHPFLIVHNCLLTNESSNQTLIEVNFLKNYMPFMDSILSSSSQRLHILKMFVFYVVLQRKNCKYIL